MNLRIHAVILFSLEKLESLSEIHSLGELLSYGLFTWVVVVVLAMSCLTVRPV